MQCFSIAKFVIRSAVFYSGRVNSKPIHYSMKICGSPEILFICWKFISDFNSERKDVRGQVEGESNCSKLPIGVTYRFCKGVFRYMTSYPFKTHFRCIDFVTVLRWITCKKVYTSKLTLIIQCTSLLCVCMLPHHPVYLQTFECVRRQTKSERP